MHDKPPDDRNAGEVVEKGNPYKENGPEL